MLGYPTTPAPSLPRRLVGRHCHMSPEGGGSWKSPPPPCASLFSSTPVESNGIRAPVEPCVAVLLGASQSLAAGEPFLKGVDG